MFTVEPIDDKVISDPKTYIIDRGGYIWFALNDDGEPVGTCALMKRGDGVFELTKMGVSPTARGKKVGEQLLQQILKSAPTIAFDTLFLLTNAKCEAAIHLYEKLGFKHDNDIMTRFGSAYERCNVAMRYAR